MAATSDPPLLHPLPKTWLQRNWKWFVPVVSVGSVLVLAAFVGLIGFFVTSVLKHSEPYNVAVARVRHSPSVAAALGTGIEPSWWVLGNFQQRNSSAYEDVRFAVRGSRGRGHVSVVASRQGDVWTYRELVIEIDATHERVDLSPSRDN